MRYDMGELEKKLATSEQNRNIAIDNQKSAEAFIDTVGVLLGVSRNPRMSAGDVYQGREFTQSLPFRDLILKTLTELKMEFAREDEGSQIEAEKASILHDMLRAALHDPTAPLEAAGKLKFLEMLKDAKDINALMNIAHNFGVHERHPMREYRPQNF